MTLLDENFPDQQRQRLLRARWPVRQVGFEWGSKGLPDHEILRALRSQRRVTFFTADSDFSLRSYCHPGYCLVYLDVPRSELAVYTIRFLRHPSFRTFAQRQGKVVRVQPTGVVYWQRHTARELHMPWPESRP